MVMSGRYRVGRFDIALRNRRLPPLNPPSACVKKRLEKTPWSKPARAYIDACHVKTDQTTILQIQSKEFFN